MTQGDATISCTLSSLRRSLGSRRQPCAQRCPTRPGASYGCVEPDRAKRSPRRFASTGERFTSQAIDRSAG